MTYKGHEVTYDAVRERAQMFVAEYPFWVLGIGAAGWLILLLAALIA